MPDLNALEAGVLAVMHGDATLTAIVPAARILDAYQRKLGTKTQPGTPLPCIGVSLNVDPRPYQQGAMCSFDVLFAVEAWAVSSDTLRSIAGRVMDIYAGAGITAAGFRTYPATIENGGSHMYDEATGVHRWIVSVSFDASPAT